ncbi:MAG: hypothetical protein QOH12_3691 [Solirubrobacteraceae bacterium]|nr:hypothetical protein [Solirubrobacteraceae bacterium]
MDEEAPTGSIPVGDEPAATDTQAHADPSPADVNGSAPTLTGQDRDAPDQTSGGASGQAQAKVEDVKTQAQDKLEDVKTQAQAKVEDVKSKAQAKLADVSPESVAQQAWKLVRKYPWPTTVAGALVVGFVLGRSQQTPPAGTDGLDQE